MSIGSTRFGKGLEIKIKRLSHQVKYEVEQLKKYVTEFSKDPNRMSKTHSVHALYVCIGYIEQHVDELARLEKIAEGTEAPHITDVWSVAAELVPNEED